MPDTKTNYGFVSAGTTLLGIGVIWMLVVRYRLLAKDISGEWGNLLLAGVGMGSGVAFLAEGLRSASAQSQPNRLNQPGRMLLVGLPIAAVATLVLALISGAL